MYTEGQNYDCDSSIESLCLVKNIKENGNER